MRSGSNANLLALWHIILTKACAKAAQSERSQSKRLEQATKAATWLLPSQANLAPPSVPPKAARIFFARLERLPMFRNPASAEFALIARHFVRPQPLHHAALGAGDDCALLAPLPGEQLAISSDMLIAGQHFFADANPAAIGHKALAVNLSDLAACGAQPLGFTLSLALPAIDNDWLAAFANGLFALADAHHCDLIGGDTTRGPLAISITIFGSVPANAALLRSGAQAGDDIYVSHAPHPGLGDARMALHLLQAQRGAPAPDAVQQLAPAQQQTLLHTLRPRLETPTPRTALGLALRGLASSAIDLSDGLTGDLPHILAASGVGATLYASAADGSGLLAATSPSLKQIDPPSHKQASPPAHLDTHLPDSLPLSLQYALAGGDDYELLFTAPPQLRQKIAQAAASTATCATRIGSIQQQSGLYWLAHNGTPQPLHNSSFVHFP